MFQLNVVCCDVRNQMQMALTKLHQTQPDFYTVKVNTLGVESPTKPEIGLNVTPMSHTAQKYKMQERNT